MHAIYPIFYDESTRLANVNHRNIDPILSAAFS
jgi:hypothetical protein